MSDKRSFINALFIQNVQYTLALREGDTLAQMCLLSIDYMLNESNVGMFTIFLSSDVAIKYIMIKNLRVSSLAKRKILLNFNIIKEFENAEKSTGINGATLFKNVFK